MPQPVIDEKAAEVAEFRARKASERAASAARRRTPPDLDTSGVTIASESVALAVVQVDGIDWLQAAFTCPGWIGPGKITHHIPPGTPGARGHLLAQVTATIARLAPP